MLKKMSWHLRGEK